MESLDQRMVLTYSLWGAELYPDATLTGGGLTASFVNQSLQSYMPQDDWRFTQSISGSRKDNEINFTTPTWGNLGAVGITSGISDNRDSFAVQWDGYLKVIRSGTQLATRSDDASRMWIDINGDGNFASSGSEFINNNWGQPQGTTTGPYSVPLATGAYRFRIQYNEIGAVNEMQLLSQIPTGAVASVTTRLNINGYQQAGLATLTSSPIDIGSVNNVFDNNLATLMRTPAINPAFVQVAFTTPKTFRSFRTYFQGNVTQFKIETADTQADMTSQTGSWAEIVPWRNGSTDQYVTTTLATAKTAKLIKMTAQRLIGDNYVHITEWEINGDLGINAINVAPGTSTLFANETIQHTAVALDSDGLMQPLAGLATWSSTNPTVAAVNATGLVTALSIGSGRAVASVAGLTGSAIVDVATDPYDLDVTFIERTPRYDYDAAKNNPAVGDSVTFQGHIKAWGSGPGSADYRWDIDGQSILTGTLTGLAAGQERVVSLSWNWQAGNHSIRLVVDPANLQTEASESNNSITDRTNALAVGFWVEQSYLGYFHHLQRNLGIGSNSWEDWAQRQMSKWNQFDAEAVWPNSPNGVLDRVRIDKIVVVPDGALPLNGGLPTNNPATDKTVDLMWGFDADIFSGSYFENTTGLAEENPFFIDRALIHEMGHARYLVDNYGFDAHLGQVQIQESGVNVAGTSRMPFLAFDEVLYYNQNGGIMSGPWPGWSPFEAGALNRIAGLRASQGNQNAPGNIGIFLNDLPQNNFVKFVDEAGLPIVGASVGIYRSVEGGGLYNHSIDNTPDLSFTTNASGIVQMPRNPFSTAPSFNGSPTTGLAVLRVQLGGNIWYRFLEVTDFNIQYWAGNTVNANYTIELPGNGTIVGPEIGLAGNGIPIPDGDSTPQVADLTEFGSTPVAGGIVTHVFAVRNSGASTLNLTGSPRVQITGAGAGDFVVTTLPSPSIGAGGLSMFKIAFDPSATGLRNVVVSIVSEDASESTFDFAIQGTGIADTTAPTIVGVYFNGLAWSGSFRSAAGNAAYGYSAQTAAGQLTPLPWSTLDAIYVKFSENVVVDGADLSVRGVNIANYGVASFTYDNVNFVARWALTGPIDTDRILLDLDGDSGTAVTDTAGNKLAGSWTDGVSTFPTAGAAAQDFKYRFVVAVGDADRNGLVRNADINVVRANLFVDAGQPGYNIYADIDGNGQIRNADLNAVRARLFVDPPAGPGPFRAGRGVHLRPGPIGSPKQHLIATELSSEDRNTSAKRRLSRTLDFHVLDALFEEG